MLGFIRARSALFSRVLSNSWSGEYLLSATGVSAAGVALAVLSLCCMAVMEMAGEVVEGKGCGGGARGPDRLEKSTRVHRPTVLDGVV